MAAPNDYTFAGYEVTDAAIVLHFINYAPGAGRDNDYYVSLTDAELAAVSTATQLRDLAIQKLQRKLKASGIAGRLDTFIGQVVTI